MAAVTPSADASLPFQHISEGRGNIAMGSISDGEALETSLTGGKWAEQSPTLSCFSFAS